MAKTADLSSLPNIGTVVVAKLKQAGINNANDLHNIGSEQAWLRIRVFDASACINMLYALDGAVQGIRWHDLSTARKEELKHFYSSYCKKHE